MVLSSNQQRFELLPIAINANNLNQNSQGKILQKQQQFKLNNINNNSTVSVKFKLVFFLLIKKFLFLILLKMIGEKKIANNKNNLDNNASTSFLGFRWF
jgi:hypothetical protein